LHEKHIEIAVIVIVEQRSAAADHFRQQQLALRAVEVSEVETCLRGDVEKKTGTFLGRSAESEKQQTSGGEGGNYAPNAAISRFTGTRRGCG